MRYRTEKDYIGEVQIPIDAYYGIQTIRAKENFYISNLKIHKQMIKSLACVKKATAKANVKLGLIDPNIGNAIMLACDDIINGRLHGQFITDMIQGGAGTSMHMNANEVIANRAQEILGHPKGLYNIVHPSDHVCFGQSTNDIVPTAGKIATIRLTKKLIVELKKLHKAYLDKANEYSQIIKMGRTHLQDAVPISLGQEFGAFASALKRDIDRINIALNDVMYINIGATAVGTGLNAHKDFSRNVIKNINQFTKLNFKQASNLFDSTRNLDSFLWLSSSLKSLAVNLSKTANDLRLMSSGPSTGFNEIHLPDVQIGSPIMPGKVNPVIPEAINQIAFQVIGNDLTITKAVEAGQLELNVFIPIILTNIFESLDLLKRGVAIYREKAIKDMTVNAERCISFVENSSGVVTALSPHIGYENCAKIAQEAIDTNRQIKDIVVEKGLLTTSEINIILNYSNMTSPGIAGEELLKSKDKK